jgi:hypothetical protein
MAPRLETRKAAGFRFVPIHRESIVVPATGMGDVIDAAPDRASGPCIIDVEC